MTGTADHPRGMRPSRPMAAVAVACLLVGSGLAAMLRLTAPAQAAVRTATASGTGSTRYLLALGDSLAAGYQPTYGTSLPRTDPATGEPDQGYPGSYPADVAAHYGLRLVDLACPGETTASMSGTPAQGACASLYRHLFGASNQQQAALDFLDAHRGQVALLTVDIGANDLDACASSSGLQIACLARGEADVTRQLPKLLGTLDSRLAGDDPGAPAVAMDYYDPFLALSFSPGGASATAEAAASVSALAAFNAAVGSIDAMHHVLTAGVARAFHTYQLVPVTDYGGKRLARNVAAICELTWMCPLDGAPVSRGDVHPRLSGYRAIASAFEAALTAHGSHP
jgi:lysophospholipase L1-like esterase